MKEFEFELIPAITKPSLFPYFNWDQNITLKKKKKKKMKTCERFSKLVVISVACEPSGTQGIVQSLYFIKKNEPGIWIKRERKKKTCIQFQVH